MGGEMDPQAWMFRYVDVESRIPESHPIRKIRPMVDEALTELEPAFADRSNGWRNRKLPRQEDHSKVETLAC